MTSIKKLILTLMTIGLISALALAFVYQWTMPKINKHQARAQERAVFAVLPGATDYEEVTKNGQTFFEGYDDSGQMVGVATRKTGPGFQGMITIMVGTDINSGKIYGIRVLEHQETPGLGAKITGQEYRSNFVDKPFGDYEVIKREPSDPYQVEAIAGATISSNKVTEIVEEAIQDIKSEYGGGN